MFLDRTDLGLVHLGRVQVHVDIFEFTGSTGGRDAHLARVSTCRARSSLIRVTDLRHGMGSIEVEGGEREMRERDLDRFITLLPLPQMTPAPESESE